MAETLGILLLCACGVFCVIAPCLVILVFMAWIFSDLGWV